MIIAIAIMKTGDRIVEAIRARGQMINGMTEQETNETMSVKGLSDSQREWVRLTDEERANCLAEAYGRHFVLCELIEAKLKEKNVF
jgi:hypothetical protein